MGEGNLDQNVPVMSRDELGTLATSFYLVLYLEVDQILWLMLAVSVIVGAAAWVRPVQASI